MCKSVVGFVLFLFALNVNAAIMNADLKTSGDKLITRDAGSGLDWLDLTETLNISRLNLLPLLEAGGTYEGWRLATNAEVVVLWQNFSIDLSYSRTINGYDSNIATASSYLGNTWCVHSCGSYPYGVSGLTSEFYGETSRSYDSLGAYQYLGLGTTTYEGDDDGYGYPDTASTNWFGHYLVKPSPVPIPAAVWLFGSGLIGLIGIDRRKKS